VRSQQERDDVTLTIAGWPALAGIGGVLFALVLVLGHLLT
jgi:hypothetical protein